MSSTPAKIAANKRWTEKNRDKQRYLNARSSARGFINNKATLDDLKELSELIKQKTEAIK